MQHNSPTRVSTPSPRQVRLTREFNAPKRLVWDCYTKPELIRRWGGGPPGWELTVCENDLRVGGAWRREMTGPNGERMAFGGVFREIVEGARLVTTEKFDDPWYEGDAESTLELSEANGKTTLTITITYASQEVRDAVLKTPMATGMEMGFAAMAAVLESLNA